MTSSLTMTHDAPRPVAAVPAPRRRTRRSLVLAAVAALVLSACGLRLETPTPTEPEPSTAEAARQAAVLDALAVQQVATVAAGPTTDPAVQATLTQVANFAGQHAAALGGVYDSGLEKLTGQAPASPAPVGDGSPGTTLNALVAAAQRTGAAADAVDDPGMARLMASIATSETLSAHRLAGQLGSGAADVLNTPPTNVDAAPSGVGASDLTAIVSAEDGAGYALEVAAAVATGDTAGRLTGAASAHRALAEKWATAARIGATPQDPRRAAYAVPAGHDAAGLVIQLDGNLTESYASLVGATAPGSRSIPAALLLSTASEAAAWGAPPTALPGLPEPTS